MMFDAETMRLIREHPAALPRINAVLFDRLYPELRARAADVRAAEGHPCFGCRQPSRFVYSVYERFWLDLCGPCNGALMDMDAEPLA